jgi:hypothetical protein
MAKSTNSEITQLLLDWGKGDKDAFDRLTDLVYEEGPWSSFWPEEKENHKDTKTQRTERDKPFVLFVPLWFSSSSGRNDDRGLKSH